ncbi:MAG: hypothetical protein ACXVBW_01345 [Bdellovibrionota bacterium]
MSENEAPSPVAAPPAELPADVPAAAPTPPPPPPAPPPAHHGFLFFAALIALACAGVAIFHHLRGPALTQTELSARIKKAITDTSNSEVVYEDVLGEGPAHWDSHPRYPGKSVNCIIWITQVLSEAYGQSLADKTPVMDALRYYGSQPAFALRKHYVTHWMALEPAPLERLDLGTCAAPLREKVSIDFDHFRSSHGFSCPLYRTDLREFDFPYYGPDDFLKCAPKLAPGFYVFFGVASERYDEMYGKESGRMGLVHGMFLEVTEKGEPLVYHASTAAHRVKSEPLSEYVARMRISLHKGYVLEKLDPAWDWTKPEPLAGAQSILKCESDLIAKGAHRQ